MSTTQHKGLCDLCGEHIKHRRFNASVFGLEGWLCGECVGELREEQAENRELELGGLKHAAIRDAWVKPAREGDLNERLAVISPGFRLTDLTLQAKARLEVIAASRRARRPPKVVVMPKPGVPCVKCGTTGGALLASLIQPARLNGAKYGSPGLHCKSCYSRLHRPTSLRCRIGGAA